MPFRSALVIPLLVTALAAGALGFFLADELRPPDAPGALSVIALPATPTPTPDPTPSSTPEASSRIRIGTPGGTDDRCPAGCTCDQQPNGIIIRCTGG